MKWHKVIIFCLLAIFFLNIFLGSLNQSFLWDEPVFVLNGLYYLTEGETYNSNQPIFGGIVAALPLVILGVEPLPHDEIGHIFKDARTKWPFFGSNDSLALAFFSKIILLFFALVVGLYIYFWGKELYGKMAGVFALFLYTFSVTVLAWTRSASPDFLSVGLMFISLYYFWRFNKEDKRKYLLISAIFFGLAFSTKLTGIFLLPILGMGYLIFRKIRTFSSIKKLFLTFFIIGLVSFLVLTFVHILDARPLYDLNDPFYQNSIGQEYRSEERLEEISFYKKDY